MKEIYRNAFSEVDAIFELMPSSLLNKIPEKFKQMIKNEKSIDYKPRIKEPLEEYVLKEETIIILALIYRDFLCSDAEKEILKIRDAKKIKETENELRKKYNPDNIFQKKQNELKNKNIDENVETSIVIIEEKWYKKLLNIVRMFFRK